MCEQLVLGSPSFVQVLYHLLPRGLQHAVHAVVVSDCRLVRSVSAQVGKRLRGVLAVLATRWPQRPSKPFTYRHVHVGRVGLLRHGEERFFFGGPCRVPRDFFSYYLGPRELFLLCPLFGVFVVPRCPKRATNRLLFHFHCRPRPLNFRVQEVPQSLDQVMRRQGDAIYRSLRREEEVIYRPCPYTNGCLYRLSVHCRFCVKGLLPFRTCLLACPRLEVFARRGPPNKGFRNGHPCRASRLLGVPFIARGGESLRRGDGAFLFHLVA